MNPLFAYTQDEQVSTWGFANNIGWKGIEIHFVAAIGDGSMFNSSDQLKTYTDPNQLAILNQHIASANSYYFIGNMLYAETKTLNIHGIFLPFRKSNSKVIRHIEWHTGLEYHLSAPKSPYTINGQEWAVQFYNRNLFLSNKLLAEAKISKSVKLYAGPQFKFTLVPFEKLELASIDETRSSGPGIKYYGEYQLNSTRFALGYGANAGLKVNLSCRFNFHFEYQYYALYRFMNFGQLSNGYNGFSFGIRYKFTKPDPIEGDKEYSPFW